ncbi:Uncharacterized protein DBV15_09482, partial [Temnothorax longispinosus]
FTQIIAFDKQQQRTRCATAEITLDLTYKRHATVFQRGRPAVAAPRRCVLDYLDNGGTSTNKTTIDFDDRFTNGSQPVSLAVSGDKMAAIQRRKTSAAKRNLAGLLVPASRLPPAGLLRYARFSWKIARLPAPSHYARRACDSNYVNTARVEYATTRRITLGQACPTSGHRLVVRSRLYRPDFRPVGWKIHAVNVNESIVLLTSSQPGTRRGRSSSRRRPARISSPIRDADERVQVRTRDQDCGPPGRKTDWPTQMHTVIINLPEIPRNRADIHCRPPPPAGSSGVRAFFI